MTLLDPPGGKGAKLMARIQTTHVGSLPRSQDVTDLLFAKEQNKPFDQMLFDETMTAHVDMLVRRQKEAGIDVVSDGETSKISYATVSYTHLTLPTICSV